MRNALRNQMLNCEQFSDTMRTGKWGSSVRCNLSNAPGVEGRLGAGERLLSSLLGNYLRAPGRHGARAPRGWKRCAGTLSTRRAVQKPTLRRPKHHPTSPSPDYNSQVPWVTAGAPAPPRGVPDAIFPRAPEHAPFRGPDILPAPSRLGWCREGY